MIDSFFFRLFQWVNQSVMYYCYIHYINYAYCQTLRRKRSIHMSSKAIRLSTKSIKRLSSNIYYGGAYQVEPSLCQNYMYPHIIPFHIFFQQWLKKSITVVQI